MKKAIFFLFAALIALVSCNREMDSPEDFVKGKVTFKASIVETKTHLGAKEGTSWPNYWSTSDVISVNGVVSEPLDASFDGSASAKFTVDGVAAPFFAAYPASAVSAYADGAATIQIPAEQLFVDGSYDPAAYIMLGKSTGDDLAFVPQMAIFSITPTGEEGTLIKSVSLTSLGDKKIAGSFTTDFESLTAGTDAVSTVTVSALEGIDVGKPWMIAIPASDFTAEGIKIVITDEDGGCMTRTAVPSKAYVAGKMYSVSIPYAADPLSLTVEGITSSTAVICWSTSPDSAYTINVYSDAGCATLLDSYSVDAGNSCWGGQSPRFCVSGLAPGMTYYVKVTNDDLSVESDVLPFTTEAFTVVEVSDTPAAIGDVILAEDFGELRWDCDVIGVGVGYFPTSQDNFGNSEVLSYQAAATSNEKVLSSQSSALADSRLAHWAQGANANLYIHPGYIKLVGSKKVTHIVTPALDNIPDGMLATLEVELTASRYYSESSASYCTEDAVVAVQAPGEYNELIDETKTNTLDLSSNVESLILPAETAWNSYKVTLTGVTKGSRIAFGAAADVSGNDARMNLSDIKVTIKDLREIGLMASLKSVSSSTAAFTWTYGGDAADDIAKPYTAAVYSDADCTTLVVSHDFVAEDSCWDGKSPCFSIGGLAPSTKYWFVATDKESNSASNVVEFTTEAFTSVDATTVTNAAVGDVLLAEDFSEIGWGPDEFAVAAGFVPSSKTLATPSGVNPEGVFTTYSNTGNRIFGSGVDLGDSRLSKGWGFFGNSAVYLRNAYLRITTTSSGARTHLVTPALSGIPAGKVATIEVTVTATKHEANDNDVAVFVEKDLMMNGTTDATSGSYKKYTGASLSEGHALGITTVKNWVTKSVTISNVDSECQLAIGSYENIDTKNRFSISDVKVTVVSLEDDPVFKIKDDATFREFVSIVAGGNKTLEAEVIASFDVAPTTDEAFSSIEDYAGTLNGKGKTIAGLTKPMFNELKGTVKDLIINSTLNITTDQVDLGILANVLSGTVEGCTSQGSVKLNVGSGVKEEHRIGGLIGKAESSGASVTNCTNEALVINETSSASDNTGELIIGGVLGCFWGTEFSISGCENSGYVVNNAYWNKSVSVGGIIGQAGNGASGSCNLTVENCTNSDAVINTGNSDSSNNVGGIIGWIRHGTYIGNTNTGTVSNSGEAPNNYIGGLFGYLDINAVFEDNSNSGKVSNTGDATSSQCIGGIVGYIGKNNAISDAGSSAKYKLTNSGDIENSGSAKNIFIGGLFGRNSSGYFNMTGTSSKYSSNSGNITDNSGPAKSSGGDLCIGGIAGYTTTGIKTQYARNSGDIYVTGDKGSTGINVGGIGGWISNASFNFNNCRNTGDVTVDCTTTSSIWAAGFVGCPKPNTTKHYFWYSNATIDTHAATVSGENYTAGLIGATEGSSANTFTMIGHKLAGTIWGSKTTTGLFWCTKVSGCGLTIQKGDATHPTTIAPGTVRKDNVNNNTVNDITDVTIGLLVGGVGSTTDLTSVIADEHLVVAEW